MTPELLCLIGMLQAEANVSGPLDLLQKWGVVNTVFNRMADPAFPHDPCAVIKFKSINSRGKTVRHYQYKIADPLDANTQELAWWIQRAQDYDVPDPTAGAECFHTLGEGHDPRGWSDFKVQLGRFRFFGKCNGT